MHMAGIQADAQPVARPARVHDRAQLLEAAAHLAALARHGFQQHRRGQLGGVHLVEHPGNQPHARLRALLHMAAGVEVEHRARDVRQALEVLAHRAEGEIAHLRIRRRRVERVRRMRQDGRKGMRLHEADKRVRILPVKGLHRAAARIARKKLKRVCADLHRLLAHGQIAVCAGEMAADMEHIKFLSSPLPRDRPARRAAAFRPQGAQSRR